jgi:recA bacterial DNA recombination protein
MHLCLRLVTAYDSGCGNSPSGRRNEENIMAFPAVQFSFLDRWTRPAESVRPAHAPPPEPPPWPTLVEPLPSRNQRADVARLRAELAATISAKISSGTELIRALEKERRDGRIATTVEALDTLLGGGLARGKMTELAGRRSSGRFSIITATLAAATGIGEAVALVDLGDHFDPQLAEAAGVDLRRMLWVRPQRMRDAVAATEMLTSAGFQLVVLDAGMYPLRGRRAPDAAWVRLARAAEAHGGALLVSTPFPLTATAAEGVVRAQSGRPIWLGRGRGPRLLAGLKAELILERHRHLRPGKHAPVEFRHVEAVRGSDQ